MKDLQTIKVVIVEDDLYYNKAMTKYVHTVCNDAIYPGYDFQIKSYLSAHECIEELDNDTDIIILDYYLINKNEDEVLNGMDVLKEVNANCKNCEVIVVSSMHDAHNTAALMRKGIYEYIDKSLNSKNRVGAVLQHLLSKKTGLNNANLAS